MVVIKCKMCGGDIELSEDRTYGTCDSCGSMVTLPRINDEQRAAAFNRGEYFRRMGEFDKALAVYERIVQEDDTDAEAHWCCALCRFGIEYVKDPATREYLPTCHRASFDSFLEDVDYLAAVEHSDGVTRRQYQKEAAKIAEVQRDILATSQNEKPFDVFVCYKESDENGQRTRDSMLAQDIYYQLTEQGLRVFFARITLEDKAGAQYEPYIFAALNSAKVMVVVGTKPEHMNAVWVKNEWSRFLALMRRDRAKLLIPCYRDMDPYDLPEQLSVLQAYDMGKIGFIQDLIRGVMKVLGKDKKPAPAAETVVVQPSESSANVTAMIKRGNMALEDGSWADADGYFERALDMDAECAQAYMGKFLASRQHKSLNAFFQNYLEQFAGVETTKETAVEMDYQRKNAVLAKAFPSGSMQSDGTNVLNMSRLKNEIADLFISMKRTYYSRLKGSEELARQGKAMLDSDRQFSRALQFARGAYRDELQKKIAQFNADLDAQVEAAKQADEESAARVREEYAKNLDKAELEAMMKRNSFLEAAYQKACQWLESSDAEPITLASTQFSALAAFNYKDSAEKVSACRQKTEQLVRAARQHKVKICTICAVVVAAVILVWVYFTQIAPKNHYKTGEALLEQKNYAAAIEAFQKAGNYQDAPQLVDAIPSIEHYDTAEALLAAGDYDGAVAAFEAAGDYEDATTRVQSTYYAKAEALLTQEDYDGAVAAFEAAGDYEDAAARIPAVRYAKGEALLAAEDYDGATKAFRAAGDYSDALQMVDAVPSIENYNKAEKLLAAWYFDDAIEAFKAAGDYEDAATRILETYYAKGEALLAKGNYDGAVAAFEAAGDYGDAATRIQATHYTKAEALLTQEDYDGAVAAFETAGDYEDAAERAAGLHYAVAEAFLTQGDYDGAAKAFEAAGDYRDAAERVQITYYTHAEVLLAQGNYDDAVAAFEAAGDYQDAAERVLKTHYAHAEALLAAGDDEGATKAFQAAGDYSDAPTRMQQEYYSRGEALLAAGDDDGATAAFKQAGNYSDAPTRMQKEYYSRGEALLAAGDDDGATAAFKQAGNYSDAQTRMPKEYYSRGEALLTEGKAASAAMAFAQAGDYQDAHDRSMALWDEIAERNTIAAGSDHTVGLKSDGTVVAAGNNIFDECNVGGWTDIVAVSAGGEHTVGLKSDGTVVVAGWLSGDCDVSDWTDIVAVSSANDFYMVGLKSDGTVVAAGSNFSGRCDVSDWTDIVAVSAGGDHTVGLKSDGTVVAVGRNYSGECNVSDWTDIVAVSAEKDHTVGLKSNGTVVAVGRNVYGECNVSDWTDIVAVSTEDDHTVGLKSNGTVVAVGDNRGGQCDVSGWTDIAAVLARGSQTIGLKSDGTVVAVGFDKSKQWKVSGWKNIKLPSRK